MNLQKIMQLILMLSLLLGTTLVHAQVTIGAAVKPIEGAILQLKNLPTDDASGANANAGLLLPRVNLEDLTSLEPCTPNMDGNGADLTAVHTGLTVFNVTEKRPIGLCKGIYIWNASQWTRIPEPCKYLGIEITPNPFIFYKSAPFAKPIQVTTSEDSEKRSLVATIVPPAQYAIDWVGVGAVYPNMEWTKTEYNLKPAMNTDTENRTSTLKMASVFEGMEFSSNLDVVQYPHDLKFESVDNTFPPTAASANSLSVESDTDWKATVQTDPSTILTSFPTAEQGRGITSFSPIVLTDNLTFKNRVATLDIESTSHPLDFIPGQTIKVKQRYQPPLLNTFSTTSIDLGYTMGVAKSITFNSNANWKLSSATGDYAKIAVSPNVAVNQIVQAGTTPLVPKQQTYTFTGSSDALATYNTVYTSQLTFESVTEATEVSKQVVNLKRTVPLKVGADAKMVPVAGTDIPITGQQVTVSLTANARIAGTAWVSGAEIPGGAWGADGVANYVNRSATFTIPALNPLWDNNRTLTVRYKTAAASYTDIGNYTQTGYSLAINSSNIAGVTSMTYPARTFSISFKGKVPANFNVFADFSDGSARVAVGGNLAARNITIPENPKATARTVAFYYVKNGANVAIQSMTQAGVPGIDAGNVWVINTGNSQWIKYSGAVAFCAAKGSGWRVPDYGELSNLVANNVGNKYGIWNGSGVVMWTTNTLAKNPNHNYCWWMDGSSYTEWLETSRDRESLGEGSAPGNAVTTCIKSK